MVLWLTKKIWYTQKEVGKKNPKRHLSKKEVQIVNSYMQE